MSHRKGERAVRLYEHEAKKVLESMGLTVPRQFGVIHSPGDLDGLDLESSMFGL